MNSLLIRAHAAILAAGPTPTPGTVVPSTFNSDGFRQGILWLAVSACMALGVWVIVKHGRSGDVGQTTNSLLVTGIGGVLIVAPLTILAIGSGATSWLFK
jgi:hypothetical protein